MAYTGKRNSYGSEKTTKLIDIPEIISRLVTEKKSIYHTNLYVAKSC
jgi:hypothetical protein